MRLSILLLISFSLIITGCGFNSPTIVQGIKLPPPTNIKSVCFENYCFEVELAATPMERARGLMYREKMENNQGMLFIFPQADFYSFWMKNTLIPLDIIWLNEDKKVVDVNINTPPCRQKFCPAYQPQAKAMYVLEINAGLAQKNNITISSRAAFLDEYAP